MNNQPEIYTVSRLNQEAADLLLQGFGTIWVEGELSNVTLHASGHWYFSLKDEQAQVRCVMFRYANQKVDFKPEAGIQISMKAKVSLYQPRGDFQLNATHIEILGTGDLQRAFLHLQAKLKSEGLFDLEHKQPFPALPQCIGIITSPTGAAIHDMLTVLKRRFASIPIIIYPSLVQGGTAATSVTQQIKLANQRKECDALIVGRGGGSLEDLWPFNEEMVAHAIFDSSIPIVSGVGHEIDITITDFVADHRAPTPSAAAEFLSPDQNEYKNKLQQSQRSLQYCLQTMLETKSTELNALKKRLADPRRKLEEYAQRLDEINSQLQRAFKTHQKHTQQHLNELARTLHAFSPLATLDRGYAIVFKEAHIIKDAKKLKAGDKIKTKLAKGEITSKVLS